MKWQPGRQNNTYEKLSLVQTKWFDCYLIRYHPGSFVDWHVDGVANKKHYRLNIRLYGEDAFEGKTLFRWWRIIFFRPDSNWHCVLPCSEKRMIFSIGWVR